MRTRTKGLSLALLFSPIVTNAQAEAAGGAPRTLEAIRKYALSYVQNLPEYTCVQVTSRTDTPEPIIYGALGRTTVLNRPTHDVIEEELSFVGGKERYKVAKVNGFPADRATHEQLGGTVSEGEFGSLLKHIFDPDTGTSFRPAPPTKLGGRAMNVFAFSVPQTQGYTVYDPDLKGEILLAYEGSVYADAETNAVMRITMKCVDIPRETRLTAVELTLEYKPIQLSGREFILPSHFELHWRKRSNESMRQVWEEATNDVDFKLYRRFTAEATIDFTEKQPPQ